MFLWKSIRKEMCDVIIKIMVTLTCQLFKTGISYGSKKLESHPHWSPLGDKFKISDKHPCHFYMGVRRGTFRS